jgi:hypothetical protein
VLDEVTWNGKGVERERGGDKYIIIQSWEWDRSSSAKSINVERVGFGAAKYLHCSMSPHDTTEKINGQDGIIVSQRYPSYTEEHGTDGKAYSYKVIKPTSH